MIENNSQVKQRFRFIILELAWGAVFFIFMTSCFYQTLLFGESRDWYRHIVWGLSDNWDLPANSLFHLIVKFLGGNLEGWLRILEYDSSYLKPQDFLQIAVLGGVFKTAVLFVITKFFFANEHSINKKYILSCAICLAMPILLISPLDLRPYLGKLSINLIHNPTYLLMAPFMLLMWYMFTRFFVSRSNMSVQWMTIFALLSFVTALAKPSFHLAFIPFCAGLSLFYIFRSRKQFFRWTMLGLVLVLPIVFQMVILKYVTPSDAAQSHFIIAPFAGASIHIVDPIGAFLSSLLFPLVYTIVLLRSKNKKFPYYLSLSWGLYLYAFLVLILFAEDGNRMSHANFYWTIYGAGLILFVESATLLIRNRVETINYRKNWDTNIIPFSLLLHFVYGVKYIYVMSTEARFF